VDLSGLIFVALAIAWAAYLIPKALKHHEEVARTRTVDKFSDRMRVVARREPVNRRDARLVVPPSAVERRAAESAARTPVAAPASESVSDHRQSNNRAARRRRRVLMLLVLALAVVGGLAGASLIHWSWVGAPAGLLVAWLVACRLMVKRERVERPAPAVATPADLADETAERPAVPLDEAETDAIPAVTDEPGLWDPVPVTLPTYVSKPTAPRSVRTIDLDGTGVWTSGRTEADSRLARDAEEAERAERAERSGRADATDERDRAVGS